MIDPTIFLAVAAVWLLIGIPAYMIIRSMIVRLTPDVTASQGAVEIARTLLAAGYALVWPWAIFVWFVSWRAELRDMEDDNAAA